LFLVVLIELKIHGNRRRYKVTSLFVYWQNWRSMLFYSGL
jgi:hypothetical protein